MSKKKLPETSLESYKALNKEQLKKTYNKISEALEALGPSTYEQIADYLKVDPQKIWKRMNEAMGMGLCYRKGDKRPMKSGRLGFVWHPGNGKDVTKQKKKIMKGPAVVDFSRAILNQPKPSQNIQSQLF